MVIRPRYRVVETAVVLLFCVEPVEIADVPVCLGAGYENAVLDVVVRGNGWVTTNDLVFALDFLLHRTYVVLTAAHLAPRSIPCCWMTFNVRS